MRPVADTRVSVPVPREDDGFSLVELMIVVGLMVFVLSAAWMAATAVGAMSDRIQAREQAATMSTVAFERMSRELRQAEPIESGGDPVKQSAPDRVVFYADIDKNNLPVRITYYVSSGYLYRTEARTTVPGGADSTYGAESAAKMLVPLDPTWTTVFTYYDGGSIPANAPIGDFSQYVAPAVVTAPGDVSAVLITLRPQVKIGNSTMTNTASAMVNLRTQDALQ